MSHQKFYGTITGPNFTLENPEQFKAHLSKLSYKTSDAKIEITIRRVRKFGGGDYEAEKTPGQRLRSVLFKYFEKYGGRNEAFERFYESWVEAKIGDIKKLLN